MEMLAQKLADSKKEISLINEEIERAGIEFKLTICDLVEPQHLAEVKAINAEIEGERMNLKTDMTDEDKAACKLRLSKLRAERQEILYEHAQRLISLRSTYLRKVSELTAKRNRIRAERIEDSVRYTAECKILHRAVKNNLVQFGNYLLSDARRETIINEDSLTSVTDADLANFFGDRYCR